jgi:vacuolar-type H+-ATPase subunit H
MNILGRDTGRNQEQYDDLFEEGALQEVLAIESRAEGIVRDAEAEAEHIVRDAEQEADGIKAQAVAEADARREKTLQQVAAEIEAQTADIQRHTEAEVQAWAEAAEENFDQVLTFVVNLTARGQAQP